MEDENLDTGGDGTDPTQGGNDGDTPDPAAELTAQLESLRTVSSNQLEALRTESTTQLETLRAESASQLEAL